MEATAGFSLSNWSRPHLERLSNDKLNWFKYSGKKRVKDILYIPLLLLVVIALHSKNVAAYDALGE